MGPNALLAGKVFGGLPAYTPSASGAIPLKPARTRLNSTSAARQMTLADPPASMQGKIIIVECVGYTNTCDVDYNDSTGATTKTFTAKDQMLILMATEGLKWFKIAG